MIAPTPPTGVPRAKLAMECEMVFQAAPELVPAFASEPVDVLTKYWF